MKDGDIPKLVRDRALAAGAGAWLDALPALVVDLEKEWEIGVGTVLLGGSEALVAEATRADGSQAVLKLLYPGDGHAASGEITALRLAGGEGCAELLRYDTPRGAMLLERLGQPLHTLGLPLEDRHAILCSAAQRMWRPAAGYGLMTGAEKARWLAEFVVTKWEDLARPCAERTVSHALRCAARREAAHDDERSVLVHGDIHDWNALQANVGFKLIDPDGLLAEPEYDLGVLMREEPLELMEADPMSRARSLAARTGLDAAAIWEWAVVERVSTGFVCISIGLESLGRQLLETADFVARGASE